MACYGAILRYAEFIHYKNRGERIVKENWSEFIVANVCHDAETRLARDVDRPARCKRQLPHASTVSPCTNSVSVESIRRGFTESCGHADIKHMILLQS